MMKYVYEASKLQLEKPTELNYIFCPTTKVTVVAEDEAQAFALATAKLNEKYHGSGCVLGEAKLVATYALAEDWNGCTACANNPKNIIR